MTTEQTDAQKLAEEIADVIWPSAPRLTYREIEARVLPILTAVLDARQQEEVQRMAKMLESINVETTRQVDELRGELEKLERQRNLLWEERDRLLGEKEYLERGIDGLHESAVQAERDRDQAREDGRRLAAEVETLRWRCGVLRATVDGGIKQGEQADEVINALDAEARRLSEMLEEAKVHLSGLTCDRNPHAGQGGDGCLCRWCNAIAFLAGTPVPTVEPSPSVEFINMEGVGPVVCARFVVPWDEQQGFKPDSEDRDVPCVNCGHVYAEHCRLAPPPEAGEGCRCTGCLWPVDRYYGPYSDRSKRRDCPYCHCDPSHPPYKPTAGEGSSVKPRPYHATECNRHLGGECNLGCLDFPPPERHAFVERTLIGGIDESCALWIEDKQWYCGKPASDPVHDHDAQPREEYIPSCTCPPLPPQHVPDCPWHGAKLDRPAYVFDSYQESLDPPAPVVVAEPIVQCNTCMGHTTDGACIPCVLPKGHLYGTHN